MKTLKPIHTNGTAIGFSNKPRIVCAERTGLAGLAMTAVGLALTAMSFKNYCTGSIWYVADEDQPNSRKAVENAWDDINRAWGLKED